MMKAMKKDYTSYSIKELQHLFEKQKEQIRQIEDQKEEMNQNAYKISKKMFVCSNRPPEI